MISRENIERTNGIRRGSCRSVHYSPGTVISLDGITLRDGIGRSRRGRSLRWSHERTLFHVRNLKSNLLLGLIENHYVIHIFCDSQDLWFISRKSEKHIWRRLPELNPLIATLFGSTAPCSTTWGRTNDMSNLIMIMFFDEVFIIFFTARRPQHREERRDDDNDEEKRRDGTITEWIGIEQIKEHETTSEITTILECNVKRGEVLYEYCMEGRRREEKKEGRWMWWIQKDMQPMSFLR